MSNEFARKAPDAHRSRDLSRRRFLLVACSSLATLSCAQLSEQRAPAAESVGLDEVMRMSRALTESPDIDAQLGAEYHAAFVRDGRARELRDFWNAAGFDLPGAPASVSDLIARGVYRDAGLTSLADSVTRAWYTGIFVGADGTQSVITYVDALAWQALGYRSDGPSACGGVFGHWADKPA